jgi:hypothetical protein
VIRIGALLHYFVDGLIAVMKLSYLHFLLAVPLLSNLSLSAQSLSEFQWFNKNYSDETYLGIGLSH